MFFFDIFALSTYFLDMRLHVFNPEHDLALAFGGERFTAPRAGREMRRWLGFLPVFWAAEGDLVMVDDVEMAAAASAPWCRYLPSVHFVPSPVNKMKVNFDRVDRVEVWGWDAAICSQLLKSGVDRRLLPSESQLSAMRRLSSRQATIGLLDELVSEVPGTVGWRQVSTSLEEVYVLLGEHRRIVLKAPWSSSGRGVRYVDGEMTASLEGFVRNTIAMQGCVIVEPFYDRILDFGVELVADGEGRADYAGLSVFNTVNGAYTGNLLHSEQMKTEMLKTYINESLLRETISRLQARLGTLTMQVYAGPLGIDMMIVKAADRYLLHPCVEVNLRRTMGHVALDIMRRTQGDFSQMRIAYDGKGYFLELRS